MKNDWLLRASLEAFMPPDKADDVIKAGEGLDPSSDEWHAWIKDMLKRVGFDPDKDTL